MSRARSGRRPIVRWALRLFRREWRQQVLVLALVTVAVAAAVAGSAVAVNAAADTTGEYGDAKALIRLDAADEATVRSGIAAARDRFGTVDVIAHEEVAVPGSLEQLDVRDQDPSGPYSRPMLALRDGRYPTIAGQAALTRGAARQLGATLGSSVTLGVEQAEVVGIVENPGDLADDFALVAPSTLTSPESYTLLVDPGGPPGEVPAGVPGQAGFELQGSSSAKAAVAATAFTAAALALAMVGLIAAAGFVVVAHRRQRQLGLLAAIGATDRHVRLVMIANGAIVGVVAAVVGTAIGIGGWLLSASAVESAAGHRVDRFDLPWTLITALVVLAVVMATVAAWWPARTASRLPVVEALSGRPVRPRPVHRSLLIAFALLVLGVIGIAMAEPMTEHARPLLLVAGLLAVVIGAVFLAPGAIRALGVLAPRLPFAPRLALRDLARHQSRAAAALAAMAFGLGIAVAVIVVASASRDQSTEGNLASNQLLIQVGDPRTAPKAGQTDAQLAELDQRAAAVAATLGRGLHSVPLDVAVEPGGSENGSLREPVALGRQRDVNTIEMLGFPYIATPEVLALYGIDASSIDAATDLLTARQEEDLTLLSDPPEFGAPPSPMQRVDLPPYSSAPNSLITEAAVGRYGWAPARAAWIVESAHPLSRAQVDAARALAADAGLAIEARSRQDGLSAILTGATAVGALLALAIVAMAIGLIRSESTRDVRTLTATGAGAATRRALTASTAGALAVLGVLLGVAGAYIALIAAYRSDLGELLPLPVDQLLQLGVGVPLVAAIAGWLLAGSEPRSFARQALD